MCKGEVWIERKELTGSERREYKRLGARKTKKKLIVSEHERLLE